MTSRPWDGLVRLAADYQRQAEAMRRDFLVSMRDGVDRQATALFGVPFKLTTRRAEDEGGKGLDRWTFDAPGFSWYTYVSRGSLEDAIEAYEDLAFALSDPATRERFAT